MDLAMAAGLFSTPPRSLTARDLQARLINHRRLGGRPTETLLQEVFGRTHAVPSEPLPPSHQHYRDSFNYVDRVNKKYYSIRWPYRVRSAHAVWVSDAMSFHFVNAHALHLKRFHLTNKQLPIKEFASQVVAAYFTVY